MCLMLQSDIVTMWRLSESLPRWRRNVISKARKLRIRGHEITFRQEREGKDISDDEKNIGYFDKDRHLREILGKDLQVWKLIRTFAPTLKIYAGAVAGAREIDKW